MKVPIHTYTQPDATAVNHAVAARQVCGCFTVAGPLEICWALSTNPVEASISLKLFGQTLFSGVLNAETPCIDFEDNLPYVAFKISICLEGSKITAKGEACVFGQCIEFDVILIEW